MTSIKVIPNKHLRTSLINEAYHVRLIDLNVDSLLHQGQYVSLAFFHQCLSVTALFLHRFSKGSLGDNMKSIPLALSVCGQNPNSQEDPSLEGNPF